VAVAKRALAGAFLFRRYHDPKSKVGPRVVRIKPVALSAARVFGRRVEGASALGSSCCRRSPIRCRRSPSVSFTPRRSRSVPHRSRPSWRRLFSRSPSASGVPRLSRGPVHRSETRKGRIPRSSVRALPLRPIRPKPDAPHSRIPAPRSVIRFEDPPPSRTDLGRGAGPFIAPYVRTSACGRSAMNERRMQ